MVLSSLALISLPLLGNESAVMVLLWCWSEPTSLLRGFCRTGVLAREGREDLGDGGAVERV